MKPEDIPPKDLPQIPEAAEDADSDLHNSPESITMAALRAGLVGFTVATGVLGGAPLPDANFAPPPPAMVQMQDAASSHVPNAGEGEPPEPFKSLAMRPIATWTPEGSLLYDARRLTPHSPPVWSATTWGKAVAVNRFQDRIVEPANLAAIIDSLPAWSEPAVPLASQPWNPAGQLVEQPLDTLLAAQSGVGHGSARDIGAEKSHASGYLREFWKHLGEKLVDPDTAADKVVDELAKLPVHLALLAGGAALVRLGFRKRGEGHGGQKSPQASDPEVVAGYVATDMFREGLERQNEILLQAGRALRLINKLLASTIDSPSLESTPVYYVPSATSPPLGIYTTEEIRVILNLVGAYTTQQAEATLALGFYTRFGDRWRFADIKKPN